MEHPTDAHKLLFELAPRSGSPVPQQWPAQQFLHRLPDVPPKPEAAVCYGNNRFDELARREGVHPTNDLRRHGTQNAQDVQSAASGKPLCHSISARFARRDPPVAVHRHGGGGGAASRRQGLTD